MVQGCSTGSLKDASSIQLELSLVSLNSYRHWLVGHSLQARQKSGDTLKMLEYAVCAAHN